MGIYKHCLKQCTIPEDILHQKSYEATTTISSCTFTSSRVGSVRGKMLDAKAGAVWWLNNGLLKPGRYLLAVGAHATEFKRDKVP